jgi:hypothetical protein
MLGRGQPACWDCVRFGVRGHLDAAGAWAWGSTAAACTALQRACATAASNPPTRRREDNQAADELANLAVDVDEAVTELGRWTARGATHAGDRRRAAALLVHSMQIEGRCGGAAAARQRAWGPGVARRAGGSSQPGSAFLHQRPKLPTNPDPAPKSTHPMQEQCSCPLRPIHITASLHTRGSQAASP